MAQDDPLARLEAAARRHESGQRPVQQPRAGQTAPPQGDPLARLEAMVGRRESMFSPERYALADRANEEMSALEKAGVTGLSAALKLLDIINTPQQMFFGAAIGLIEGANLIDAALEGARNNVMDSD